MAKVEEQFVPQGYWWIDSGRKILYTEKLMGCLGLTAFSKPSRRGSLLHMNGAEDQALEDLERFLTDVDKNPFFDERTTATIYIPGGVDHDSFDLIRQGADTVEQRLRDYCPEIAIVRDAVTQIAQGFGRVALDLRNGKSRGTKYQLVDTTSGDVSRILKTGLY